MTGAQKEVFCDEESQLFAASSFPFVMHTIAAVPKVIEHGFRLSLSLSRTLFVFSHLYLDSFT